MAQSLGAPSRPPSPRTAQTDARRVEPEAFFNDYLSRFPNATDEEALRAWDEFQEGGRGIFERAADAVIPTALRIGGTVAGGVLGAAAGPAGIIAGGAAGSGIGETAAELYETWRGDRSGINPKQIATQTALGAVPLGGRAASIARNVARRAAQGGVMGGAATAMTSAAEGQRPTGGDILSGAALGTVVGAGAGRLEAAITPRPPQLKANLPRLDVLEQARKLAASPSVIDRVLGLPRAANRALVDQFTDVRKFVKEGERAGGLSVLPESDPRNLIDLVYGGQSGRVENAFRDYQEVVREAQQLGLEPALRQLLDLRGLSRGADTLTEHAADAFARGDVKAMNTILGRLAAGESLPAGYTPGLLAQDLTAFERQLGPKFQDVERLAGKVFALNRKALDVVHDAGIIPDDVYAKLTARGNDYVPLSRILDGVLDAQTKARAANLSLKQQKVLFTLEGSKRATQDPIAASMSRMQEAIREAGRNEAAKSLVELRNLHPAFANQIFEVPAGGKAPKGFGTIGVFEKGQKKLYAVPEEVASAMNLADANEVRLVGNTMLAFTRNMLQKLATGANLAFSVPNVVRDIADARKLSTAYRPYNPKDLASFVGEWANALRERMVADPEYRKFLEARAGYSTLQKNIDPERFLNPGASVNPLNVISDINSVLEESTKLTTFKRLKAQGKSDVRAAIETRRFGGSPDFARKGSMAPELNLLVMFFNASVQGVARTLTRLNPVKYPGRVATLLGGASLTTMALDRWNSQFVDPDGTPALDRVSEVDRKNNFIILKPETYRTAEGVERHSYFKIPKSHAAKLIFGPIEAAIGSAKADATQVALDTAANLSPVNMNLKRGEVLSGVGKGIVSSLNPALKAPLEQVIGEGGFDTFRGVPIVPRRMQDLDASRQFDANTSPTIVRAAQVLNEYLGTELSPKRIEAFLRSGPLVGPGESVLSVVDDLVAPQDISKLQGDELAARSPVLGPIMRRFVGSSVDQTEKDAFDQFYSLLDRATKAKRTLNDMAKRAPGEVQSYLSNPERKLLIGAEPSLRKISDAFSQIRAARQMPGADLERIAAAERELLARTREVMELLAQRHEGKPAAAQPQARLRKSTIDRLYEKYLAAAGGR